MQIKSSCNYAKLVVYYGDVRLMTHSALQILTVHSNITVKFLQFSNIS